MIRGTTPQIMLTIEGHDLTNMEYVVSFACGAWRLNKTQDDCELLVVSGDSQIIVPLTQQETLSMRKDTATVQVNWISSEGKREATEAASFSVKTNIYEKVMTYGQ